MKGIDIMGDLTKNFSRSEFACKCGCGFDDVDMKLVNMCQEIRDYLGVPVRINSACRCEKHNKNVGGVGKKIDPKTSKKIEGSGSKHMYGKAADLSCSKGGKAIFDAIHKMRDNGQLKDLDYAIYYSKKNFVHIDCGGKRNSLYETR